MFGGSYLGSTDYGDKRPLFQGVAPTIKSIQTIVLRTINSVLPLLSKNREKTTLLQSKETQVVLKTNEQ